MKVRQFRMDDPLWIALGEVARARKTTMSDLIREAVIDTIKKHNDPPDGVFIDGIMSIHEKLDTKTNDFIDQNKCLLLILQGSLASLTGKLLQIDKNESLAQYKVRQKEAFNESVADGYRELGPLQKAFDKAWAKVKARS